MRKRFDDLSRTGKSKFLKRVKLSTEEKSSCANNGVEKTTEENINKKNRSLNSVIPSTSKDNGDFERIFPLNNIEESQEGEIMGQIDEKIRRQVDEERVRQDIEDEIIHEDEDEEIIEMDSEGTEEEIEESSSDQAEDTEAENGDELEEIVEQEEEDEGSDGCENMYDDEDTNRSEVEEIINHEIRINNNNNNNRNNNYRNNMRNNLEYDNQYDNEFYERLVYEDAPLTVAESMIIMMSLVLKHNLSDSCVDDILEAISMHCLPENLQK